MKTTILLILLVLTKIICGQDSLTDCKFSIKTAPLSLINLYDGPCYKIGAEIKLYKNVSTYIEYGGYIPVGHTGWWWKENAAGFQIRPEIKLYLNEKGLTSGNYISVEYFYKKQNFDFWATIKYDTTKTLTNYHIWKEVSCFNIKYGELLIGQKSRFFIEYFAGLGVWFNNGKDNLTDTDRKNIQIGEGQGGIAAGLIRSTEQQTWLNITAGLKLGFRIK